MNTLKKIALMGIAGILGLMSGTAQAQCALPTNLAVDHLTGTAATISWDYDTTGGNASGFALLLTNTTTAATTTYTIGADSRRQVVVGLNERTGYRVDLVANCSSDTATIQFATPCASGGDRAIGDGTGTIATVPVRMFSKYSISQQLFTAAEMTGLDSILGLKFEMTSGAVRTRQVDIYLDTTSKTSYTMSTTEHNLPQDSSHLYFSGSIDFSIGWVTVMLDRNFATVAGKGVVLTVVDHTGTSGGVHNFRRTDTDSCMSLFDYRNTSPYDASLTDAISSVPVMYRANVVFLSPCGEDGCLPPYFTDAEAGVTSVSLDWWDNGGTSWRVEYRKDYEDAWITATSLTYSDSYLIDGLQSGADYVIRVGNHCDIDSVEYSEVSVATLCPPSWPIPFVECFEHFTAPSSSDEMQHCWYRSSVMGFYPQLRAIGMNSTQSMAFARRGTLVLPVLAAPNDTLGISFWAMNPYRTKRQKIEVGVAADPADTNTYLPIDTVTIGEVNDEWLRYAAYLDGLADSLYEGRDHIFFRSLDDKSDVCYLDSLRVDYIPACRRIGSATVENIGSSSVTVAIGDRYNHDSYTVVWWNEDGRDSLTATTDTVVITGLQSDSTYHFAVHANCGSAHSVETPVLPQTVRTACLPLAVTDSTPYYNDFEDGTLGCFWVQTDDKYNTWTNCDDEYYSAGGGLAPHSGGRHAKSVLRTGSDMLVLPTFDFSGLTTDAELSFWHYQKYYNGSLWETTGTELDTASMHTPAMRVYYRTSEDGEWSYVAKIDSLQEDVWKLRAVTLPASQGAAVYQVGIKAFHKDEYIDDIRVGIPDSAGGTLCEEPTDVTVSNIDESSAMVKWNGSASAYSVQWRRKNSFAWYGITVVDDSVTIGPLDNATQYVVRVQALCSEPIVSAYSDAVQFETEFCSDVMYARNYTAQADTFSIHGPFYTQVPCSYSETFVNRSELSGMQLIRGFDFFVTDPGYQTTPWGDTVMAPDPNNPAVLIPNCAGLRFNDVDIYMALTSDTSLSATSFAFNDSAFHKVCSNCDLSFTDTGMRRVYFDSTFVYDGTSNVILGIYQYIPTMGTGDIFAKYAAHEGDTSITGVHCGYGGGMSTFMCTQAHLAQIPEFRQFSSHVVPDLDFLDCKASCNAPTPTPVIATANSLTAGWYNPYYTVRLAIKKSSDSIWSSNVTVSNANSHTFYGLENMTAYDIRMQRVCGEEDASEWVVLQNIVTERGCPTPTGITVSAVTGSSATIGWNDSLATSARWELNIRNNNGFERYYEVATNPATIDGLMPNREYYVMARTFCDESGARMGEWSDLVGFNNICHPATDLVAESHDGNVYLSWTAGERNQQWVVTYGYSGYERNQRLGFVETDTTAVVIEGLLPEVSYGFRVVAVCGEDWQAGWTGAEVTATVSTEGIGDVDGCTISLYPNPASKSVTVAGLEGGGTVEVIDVSGRSVASYHATETTLTIDVRGYVRGTYFVRITDTTGCSVRKLVVR